MLSKYIICLWIAHLQNISKMRDVILVVGSSGQIGTELVIELRRIYGSSNVIASDIRIPSDSFMASGPFEELDILDKNRLYEIVKKSPL